MKIYIKITTFR